MSFFNHNNSNNYYYYLTVIAIVHSIYSQSVHALALNAGSMDNDAGWYCTYTQHTHYIYITYTQEIIDTITESK